MAPHIRAQGPQLVFQPTWWQIVLLDGSIVDVRADGAKEDAQSLRFVVLVDGDPDEELELIRISLAAVASWEGGWSERRGAD